VKTFFTVPNGYDLRSLGNATVAPSGMKAYTSGAIPGWRTSLLLTAMTSGVVFRMPLTGDSRNPVGTPVAYFKSVNRYRDIVVAPDGVRLYVVTDVDGRSTDATGALSRELVNPGALLEFTYTGAATF
jgi:glucose/arabinose dehydrogenase